MNARAPELVFTVLPMSFSMLDWIQHHEVVVAALALCSAVTFILTLVAVPVIAVRVPPDYFVSNKSQTSNSSPDSLAVRMAIQIVRRIAGILLLFMGLLMLVLPGQGILTILFGLVLLDAPGTHRLGHWLIRRPTVFASVNWLRHKAGKPSLICP